MVDLFDFKQATFFDDNESVYLHQRIIKTAYGSKTAIADQHHKNIKKAYKNTAAVLQHRNGPTFSFNISTTSNCTLFLMTCKNACHYQMTTSMAKLQLMNVGIQLCK